MMLLLGLPLFALLLWLLWDRLRQAKRRAQELEERQMILESLGEGVIVVDPDLNVEFINAIGAKMIGVARKALIGQPFPQNGHSPFLERCRYLLEMCQKSASVATDSFAFREMRRRSFDLIATPKGFSKGSTRGAILILQDKSSHHKVLEMGRDFAANASHELRTPITIIKGFAETLQDFPELPPEMLTDIIEKIVRNCQRMDTLVKNLLTLADLDNLPESRFQDCDFVMLAEICRQVVSSVYEDAEISIEKTEGTAIVYADPDILELAIRNLLDNAAKYSNPPAKITIEIEPQEEMVKVCIRDRGIGIPLFEQEHIFERFYTVDKARSRRFGGAGLGLSIVSTIIEKHHGTISVESVVGEGTNFTLLLPKNAS